MIWIIIVAVIWAVGFFYTYGFVFNNNWENRLWFSVFWPCVLPLWLIHKIHNKE